LKQWKGKTTVELLEEDSGFHKDLIQGTHWIWTHFSFPWPKKGLNVAFFDFTILSLLRGIEHPFLLNFWFIRT
jgi:hypothetical protein